MLTGFHARVAELVGAHLGPQGFALGGGYALQVHGVVDRDSKDLDNYTSAMDADVFARAEESLVAALTATGYSADVVSAENWFRQVIVTDPASGESVSVDLGYDYREHPPIVVTRFGPVLDLEDVIVGKVRALTDRQAERDFYDVDAILDSGRKSVGDIRQVLTIIRPEMTDEQVAALLRGAHLGDPDEYAALGMSLDDMAAMFDRLSAEADTLLSPNGPAAPQSVSEGGGRNTVTGSHNKQTESTRRTGVQPRVQSGTPGGGQFASREHAEGDIELSDPPN